MTFTNTISARTLRVAAAAVNQTPLDWNGNLQRLVTLVAQAKAEGVQLLLLPELALTGYGCEDAFHRPGTCRRAEQQLLELVKHTDGIAVAVGLPVFHHRKIYNAVAMLINGEVCGFYCKQNLAGDGVHYEQRWFKPWPKDVRGLYTTSLGAEIPIGDIFFSISGTTVGFEICEDAWVADRPGVALARRGVDVILNPSASHFAFGKVKIREGFVREGSRAYAAVYVYANLLGNESGRLIFDGDRMIAQNGDILTRGHRFSFQEGELTSAVVDLDAVRRSAARTTSFNTNPGIDPACVRVDSAVFADRNQLPTLSQVSLEKWECSPNLKEEEFTRAEALGLFDYLRKAKNGGYVVSLSGGADSTAVATLTAMMVRIGVKSLGLKTFQSRLPCLQTEYADAQSIVGALLATVYQKSANSSQTTEDAARIVAEALGAKHFVFDIEPVVSLYEDMIRTALGRELTWEEFDIPLQNLQARSRAPSAWALANFLGFTLLVTSNRSEAAVGYATMDGDTSGGMNPIGGFDKMSLLKWLSWMETTGPDEIGPIPELSVVNKLKPTAELRPQEQAQTDEDDLMPYPVLNLIEALAIRDGFEPLDVLMRIRGEFGNSYKLLWLYTWVNRFFSLWSRNQWKRERFAISFHVDDRNLDPKTWCRFPVLSGGFELELEELRAYYESCNTSQ